MKKGLPFATHELLIHVGGTRHPQPPFKALTFVSLFRGSHVIIYTTMRAVVDMILK